jgi:hypothetical protein
MYEDNKELCDVLTTIFDQSLCSTIFRIRPHKVWQMWERYSSRDMVKFLNTICVENKREFYRWIHVNIMYIWGLYRPVIDEDSDILHEKIKEVFNRNMCDTIYQKDSECVWNMWMLHEEDTYKFLQSINVKDKLALLFSVAVQTSLQHT